jgi:hypothetical protein
MKTPILLVLAGMLSSSLYAETSQQPQQVDLSTNGDCPHVKPGDEISFTLTVKNLHVPAKKPVNGELLLSLRKSGQDDVFEIGGRSSADAPNSDVLHFHSAVPRDIQSGEYRGVSVTIDESPKGRTVTAIPQVQTEVARYCLNVESSYVPPVAPKVASPEIVGFQPDSPK